jgi:hypothetical protein
MRLGDYSVGAGVWGLAGGGGAKLTDKQICCDQVRPDCGHCRGLLGGNRETLEGDCTLEDVECPRGTQAGR